jgi:hypothetical protein
MIDEGLDYYKMYRGKCLEMSQALVSADKDLTLVRGHYLDDFWGPQPHWWCKRISTGEIVDPTVRQFPTGRSGISQEDRYEMFDGWIECEECGKRVQEENAYLDEHHVFCSSHCFGVHVGLI